MTPEQLKQCIRGSALNYARSRGLHVNESRKTAILFSSVGDNMHPASYERIEYDPVMLQRTKKAHQVPGYKEMQSSNSSDALLMSVCGHPKSGKWKGLHELLGVPSLDAKFGVFPKVTLKNGRRERTEIDLALGDVFVEAKLTERDFKAGEAEVVHNYARFDELFDVGGLKVVKERYANYQVIRNLLAAAQHSKNHLLICDERRPDLVRAYYETVCCLKATVQRKRCRVVFWQEIARVVGDDLRNFLNEKYGIN